VGRAALVGLHLELLHDAAALLEEHLRLVLIPVLVIVASFITAILLTIRMGGAVVVVVEVVALLSLAMLHVGVADGAISGGNGVAAMDESLLAGILLVRVAILPLGLCVLVLSTGLAQ